MEKMDKGLTFTKWVLINRLKIPQFFPKLICPSPKFWDFDKKRLHWASVVRAFAYLITCPHCQFSEFSFTFIFWHYIHEEINNQDHVGFFLSKYNSQEVHVAISRKKLSLTKRFFKTLSNFF